MRSLTPFEITGGIFMKAIVYHIYGSPDVL